MFCFKFKLACWCAKRFKCTNSLPIRLSQMHQMWVHSINKNRRTLCSKLWTNANIIFNRTDMKLVYLKRFQATVHCLKRFSHVHAGGNLKQNTGYMWQLLIVHLVQSAFQWILRLPGSFSLPQSLGTENYIGPVHGPKTRTVAPAQRNSTIFEFQWIIWPLSSSTACIIYTLHLIFVIN